MANEPRNYIVSFATEKEAKDYALRCLAPMMGKEQVQRTLSDHKKFIDMWDEMGQQEEKAYWTKMHGELLLWQNSHQFQQGLYPPGIDTLLFDAVEWRAALYSFGSITEKERPFYNSYLFKKWVEGAATSLVLCLAGIFSKDPRCNSLLNLWISISSFLEGSVHLHSDEFSMIQKIFNRDRKNPFYSDDGSKLLKCRNKVIAHHECSFEINLADFDMEFHLASRIWNILNKWAETGSLFPFPDSETVFQNFNQNFDSHYVRRLKEAWQENIRQFYYWETLPISDSFVEIIDGA